MEHHKFDTTDVDAELKDQKQGRLAKGTETEFPAVKEVEGEAVDVDVSDLEEVEDLTNEVVAEDEDKVN